MNNNQIKASDAKSILDSPVFKDAFNSVRDAILSKMLSCDSKETANDAVVSLQLLEGISRALKQYVEEGVVEDILEERRLKDDEARKKVLTFNRGF